MSRKEHQIEIDVKGMLARWPSVGYDIAAGDGKVLAFYNNVGGEKIDRNSFFYKKKLTDIFIFSMLLGKKDGVKEQYTDKKSRRGSIDALRFADKPEYVWMMLAVAIDEISKNDPKRDLTEILNPENAKEVIEICEGYANHGIHELIEMNSKEGFLGYEEKFEDLLKE